MAKVTIYTVTGCPFCARAKAWLEQHQVAFEERDTATNDRWVDDVIKLTGHGAVPVTLIGGETIVGYDVPKLEAALKKA
ncbi:MAG: glutaredoxin family protein [Candidatus Andersenbacteria bacterium]